MRGLSAAQARFRTAVRRPAQLQSLHCKPLIHPSGEHLQAMLAACLLPQACSVSPRLAVQAALAVL